MVNFPMIAGAVTVVLISWLWSFLFSFAVRPYLQTKRLRDQGVKGPPINGSFWDGHVEEIQRMKKETQDLVLDTKSHNYLARISPHHVRWASLYENNRRRWRLEKKLRETLVSVIEQRLASKEGGYGHDLLGLMMEACVNGEEGKTKLSMDEIIDECKTFFFAGHETTSHLLTWTMFLLSSNQDWQKKLREEVFAECGKEIPDPDQLGRLKLMTAVLLESLRLYAPVGATGRTTQEDTTLGPSLTVPKGTDMIIPISAIHHNKEIWGPDAGEFNPMRFENGASKAASHPSAMLAFSMGPRVCVGQNFALMEAKTVLSMILQSFSFSLSPNYKHMPADRITLQPAEGMHVVLKPLDE